MNLDKDLARLFRAKSGHIIAVLLSHCNDLQLAEDAVQDAFLQAHQGWRDDAMPRAPEAWLMTTAKRRLIDTLRHTTSKQNNKTRAHIAATLTPEQTELESDAVIPDERLRLIFTCCHPALKPQAQVALTLKTLCGLSSREIARAYLTSETTMNQRLVRAKQKIKHAGIAYIVPEGAALEGRLESVLATLYLIYNESYSAFEGQSLTRGDLAEEAIRLARVLNQLLPRPDTAGLLALMLLHQARRPARSSAESQFIALENQDRSCWDHARIAEGQQILIAALKQGRPDKYQLQAAISALHSEAPSWEQTDWRQIYLLYQTLYKIEPSSIVKLNSLVALAQMGVAQRAYDELRELENALSQYQPFFAAKASIEKNLGRLDDARRSYEQAIALTGNEAQRAFLRRCLNLITPAP